MHVYKKPCNTSDSQLVSARFYLGIKRDGEAQGMLGDYIFQLSLEKHGKDCREEEKRATPLTLLTPRPQSEQAIKERAAGWTFKDLQITPSLKHVKNKRKRRSCFQVHQYGDLGGKS